LVSTARACSGRDGDEPGGAPVSRRVPSLRTARLETQRSRDGGLVLKTHLDASKGRLGEWQISEIDGRWGSVCASAEPLALAPGPSLQLEAATLEGYEACEHDFGLRDLALVLGPTMARHAQGFASQVDSPAMTVRLTTLTALLALMATGCGGTSAIGGASPKDTVRTYVDAVNAHDGETVCALLVESAAAQFSIPGAAECPKVVSGYIGYGEESDTDTFQSARILDLDDGKTSGELRSVKARIELQLNDQGDETRPLKKTLDDVAWLVERDGRWRLAKASGLLYAAFAAYSVPDDIFAAPDIAAQDRAYRQKTAAEAKAHEAEQATFREPEPELFTCKGRTSSYDDAADDLHIEGSRTLQRDEARRYGAADVRRVEVDTEGDDLCVRIRLGGSSIKELLTVRFDIYSPNKDATYLGPQASLHLQVRGDGRARLAYEDWRREDEYGRHPYIALPARIGHDGAGFSFKVKRADILPAVRGAGGLPEWSGFLWGGITFYAVTLDGAKRAISDDLHNYLSMVSHPGGEVFESGERQHRDLPTGPPH
jgi:hypothetical protein